MGKVPCARDRMLKWKGDRSSDIPVDLDGYSVDDLVDLRNSILTLTLTTDTVAPWCPFPLLQQHRFLWYTGELRLLK